MVLAASPPRFQVHAVANDHDAVESQSRLGAVPGDELVDGVFVHAARGRRAEAVEHGQFAMIQIRQSKHPATVIRLDSLFAHGDGLPCRRIGTTADRPGSASLGRGDFERYRLIASIVAHLWKVRFSLGYESLVFRGFSRALDHRFRLLFELSR